ncbi:hypothetical protein [Halopseudomonas sp.]|jgi:hypothetical protein|uniref:hypothetical protein n=1 Tax=Halopseudomonas sp. TaxID=2901191 RepID=UPI0030024320
MQLTTRPVNRPNNRLFNGHPLLCTLAFQPLIGHLKALNLDEEVLEIEGLRKAAVWIGLIILVMAFLLPVFIGLAPSASVDAVAAVGPAPVIHQETQDETE